MMVSKVRGRFSDFSADIVTADDPLPSTRQRRPCRWPRSTPATTGRDDHLRTNDFFDVEKHPTMTFRSTGLDGSGADYELHGDLTIKGVTKPVTFDLEVGGVGKDPWGNTKAGFTVTGTINRKDFGMEYNAALETGGVLVGDKVTIELDIEATLPELTGVA